MAFQMLFDVFKITEYRDGCVYKTTKAGEVWLNVQSRTHEEENAIASEHGGDILAPTMQTRICKKV